MCVRVRARACVRARMCVRACVILICPHLEECRPVLCQEHRRFQQPIQPLVEVGVLQSVPCDEEEEGGERGNRTRTTTVVGSGEKVTGLTTKYRERRKKGWENEEREENQ